MSSQTEGFTLASDETILQYSIDVNTNRLQYKYDTTGWAQEDNQQAEIL